MLSTKVGSDGENEVKGKVVESLRFEEDNGSLLELFPFDRLLTLENKCLSEVFKQNERAHFLTATSVTKPHTYQHILEC